MLLILANTIHNVVFDKIVCCTVNYSLASWIDFYPRCLYSIPCCCISSLEPYQLPCVSMLSNTQSKRISNFGFSIATFISL